MNIVVLDSGLLNPGDLSWAPFEKLGRLTLYENTLYEERIPHVAGAEVVLTNRIPLSRRVLEASPGLRYIGLFSTGFNQVDLETATRMGIAVANVPGYGTQAVAVHTIALLLALTNHVAAHSAAVHSGGWANDGWCYWKNPSTELTGKVFGAVGFGSIGQAAGRIAAAMGMRVLACGSRPTEEGRAIAQYVTLDELLQCSDVVSLHCPLLPETQQIIRQETINKMKPGALLLNTARGGLVNDEDLARALVSGRLGGAGLDVLSKEPPLPDNPLLVVDNCLITPHMSWAARDTRARLLAVVAENLQSFLEGQPSNIINPLYKENL